MQKVRVHRNVKVLQIPALLASLFFSLASSLVFAAAPVELADGKEPQLAADSHAAYLTFAKGNQILFSSSSDLAQPFSPPTPVVTLDHLMVGMHRGPHIAAADDDTLVITAITDAHANNAFPGDLVSFRSTDHGKTWSAPTRINDSPTSAREGLHSLAAGSDRKLYAVWLDLRTGRTRIEGALSRDAGLSWEPNDLIYQSPAGSVCECCQPSALFLPTGKVAVLFRNSLAGNRDMYLATFSPGSAAAGVQIQKLGDTSWPLAACPMDGGSLSLTPDGLPAAVYQSDGTLYRSIPNRPSQKLGLGIQPASSTAATAYITSHNGQLLFLGADFTSPPQTLVNSATHPVLTDFNGHPLCAFSSNNKIYLLAPN